MYNRSIEEHKSIMIKMYKDKGLDDIQINRKISRNDQLQILNNKLNQLIATSVPIGMIINHPIAGQIKFEEVKPCPK